MDLVSKARRAEIISEAQEKARPTAKDIAIERLVNQVDFDQTCVHRREDFEAFVREAYEAGQRDPLPVPGDMESMGMGFTEW